MRVDISCCDVFFLICTTIISFSFVLKTDISDSYYKKVSMTTVCFGRKLKKLKQNFSSDVLDYFHDGAISGPQWLDWMLQVGITISWSETSSDFSPFSCLDWRRRSCCHAWTSSINQSWNVLIKIMRTTNLRNTRSSHLQYPLCVPSLQWPPNQTGK